MSKPKPPWLKDEHIVLHHDRILSGVSSIADLISREYIPQLPLHLLVIKDGALRFAEDLCSLLTVPFVRTDIKVSSYYGGRESSGMVVIENAESLHCEGQQVIIIDEIYDTGRTLEAVQEMIEKKRAAAVKTAVLFYKERKHEHTVLIDYAGLAIPDTFVIGYGMDLDGKYRDLDHLYMYR